MPLYKIRIRKQWLDQIFGSGIWSNTYHVTAVDEEGALTVAAGIVPIEQSIHWNDQYFIDMSAQQDTPLAGSGRKVALGVLGNRDPDGLERLPGFNVVRATFTDGIARPDQKYLRPRIIEEEQSNGSLTPTAVTFYTTNYVTPLLGYVGLVSSDGVPYTSGVIFAGVQMRQLSWSRRARPGFHRGYVPNS